MSTNRVLVGAFMFLVSINQAFAHETVLNTKITRLNNWSKGGHLLVHTEAPLVNPANCSVANNYVLPGTDSDIARALLLAALAGGVRVTLVIDGLECVENRARIIQVQVASE